MLEPYAPTLNPLNNSSPLHPNHPLPPHTKTPPPQWYYFAVGHMRSDVDYTFNMVNLVKPDSLYNAGMRPALYSKRDASLGLQVPPKP